MEECSEEESHDFYNPFRAMHFNYDRCFLCGADLLSSRTVEHIWPRWIQNKYDLWDQRLTLLNGTDISYRQLTVPCCEACNNMHLAQLEREVADAFEAGVQSVRNLSPLRLYQWMGKVVYGLLFKELSLQVKRSDPTLGPIMTPDVLESMRTLHGFLQSLRMPFEFVGFKPWSLFILRTLDMEAPRDFDFHNNFMGLTFAVRMGSVGVVACLEDSGTQEELFSKLVQRFQDIPLHPVQFSEFAAKVTYKAHLMNRIPKYLTMLPEREGDKVVVVSPPLQGFSRQPLFDRWSQREYARVLSHYVRQYGFEFTDLFREPNHVLTWLQSEDGRYNVMNKEGLVISLRGRKRRRRAQVEENSRQS